MNQLNSTEANRRRKHADYMREYNRKNAARVSVQRSARAQKRKAADPDGHRERCTKWAKANKEKMLEHSRRYYQRHKEKHAALMRQWRECNPHMSRHYRAERRALERMATPVWADRAAILAIYKRASETGMEVDHTIPLNGKNVCGLHVETNLQLLTSEANRRKSNRHESA